MKETIFREYDIRGIVDEELFIDNLYDLTRAITYYFLKRNPNLKTIAVGMDGRTHSPAIKKEICKALADSGINVLFLGVCPSPALYFALHTEPVDGGLMITASHNTKEYNGIKICLGTRSIWGKELQTIKKLYKEKKHVTSKQVGTIQNYPIVPHYIDWLCHHFNALRNMNSKIIIDCGNGVAGTVLPELIQKMNWKNVSLLYPEVDGSYPNHEADPTVLRNMQDLKHALETTDAAFGVGLDGDCDRMAVMTKEGWLVPGDQLLALFTYYLLPDNPNAAIVFDIKSSSGLTELLEQWNAKPVMSPSGHSIIKDIMQKHNSVLGGELSCHFFFNDRYFGYDDGIYSMLRFFEIVAQTKKSVTELMNFFPHKESSPEFRLACPEEKKAPIVQAIKQYFSKEKDATLLTIDGVLISFPFGWGIVRASNTQAALSMRFESDTKKGLQKVMEAFYTALHPHLDKQALEKLHRYKEQI